MLLSPALTIPSPALCIPLPFLFTPLPVRRFPNKLAPNVPNNILRNPPFCSFTSFWTDSVTPFNNNPESSRDFTILIRSSMSLFDIISVVWPPDPNIFLYIPASAADGATVNPKGINTLLANDVITFFIKVSPVFSNGPSNLPSNPPDCIIFDDWVFEGLIWADELLENALRIVETYLPVNNNSCGKLVSSLESPVVLGDILIITSVSFYIADFSLFSWEVTVLYLFYRIESFYIVRTKKS